MDRQIASRSVISQLDIEQASDHIAQDRIAQLSADAVYGFLAEHSLKRLADDIMRRTAKPFCYTARCVGNHPCMVRDCNQKTEGLHGADQVDRLTIAIGKI